MDEIREQEVYVSEIAQFLNSQFEGEDFIVKKPATIEDLSGQAMIYIEKMTPELQEKINRYQSVLIIADNLWPVKNGAVLTTDHPRLSFVRVLKEFFVEQSLPTIQKTAIVSPQASIGANVTIGEYCLVGPKVIIDNGSEILSGVVLAGKVKIGKNCLIKDRAVIGSEGYGFVFDEYNKPVHFPQFGQIIIGDNVWIGSNTTIERAAFKDTLIGDNVKIDDLVHIGNGCRIDQNTMITAGTIISENVWIGANCWIMPNVSIRNDIQITSQVTVGIGSVVVKDLMTPGVYVGNPARWIKK
jgi:UDP-3-O-[3-hydroxymyristoyl] glucosamine N-acyltransferase